MGGLLGSGARMLGGLVGGVGLGGLKSMASSAIRYLLPTGKAIASGYLDKLKGNATNIAGQLINKVGDYASQNSALSGYTDKFKQDATNYAG